MAKTLHELGLSSAPATTEFHSLNWISASLQRGERASANEFLVPRTHFSPVKPSRLRGPRQQALPLGGGSRHVIANPSRGALAQVNRWDRGNTSPVKRSKGKPKLGYYDHHHQASLKEHQPPLTASTPLVRKSLPQRLPSGDLSSWLQLDLDEDDSIAAAPPSVTPTESDPPTAAIGEAGPTQTSLSLSASLNFTSTVNFMATPSSPVKISRALHSLGESPSKRKRAFSMLSSEDEESSSRPSKRRRSAGSVKTTFGGSFGAASSSSSSVFSPNQDSSELSGSTVPYQAYIDSVPPHKKAMRERQRKYYAGQKPPAKRDDNLNTHLTDIFDQLAQNCAARGEVWRKFTYAAASRQFRNCREKIVRVEQVQGMPRIGKRLQDKVSEILRTGTLQRVELEAKDSLTVTVKLFESIWGVGSATALKWYRLGYRTLDDIRSKCKVNHQQATGLQYYEEFKERIPRAEVTQLGQIVKDEVRRLDRGMKVKIVGSYRRKKLSCGDIDILICHKDVAHLENFLPRVLTRLHALNFLTDDLTAIEPGVDSYMGVCQLKPTLPHRRIDIKVYPPDEWGPALLYFTGSGHFNRSMRLWARKNGYSLSEHSLVRRYGTGKDDQKGDPIPGLTSERAVFDILGWEYKPPHQRELEQQ
eukprot:TRINITY_DN9612_c0_g1_i1.p1 TRINITY_DN9612_c0_g1~~TRINITY_DN9612_c0_g1_i1.p1  ORF type:complete len:645 (-),score=84.38 TRINITY_DN9612_c0_g1_i1:17-1951(-)